MTLPRVAHARQAAYPRLSILLLFLACYFASALFLQIDARNIVPPWEDGSAIEQFTAGLLWMLTLLALLIAEKHHAAGQPGSQWRTLFWLAGCAAAAVVAIDEVFAFHEYTADPSSVGDDDPVKLLMYFGAAAALVSIVWVERPPRRVIAAFAIGFFFNTLYALVEFGDGDYFQVPYATLDQLRWAEEIFELLALSSYMVGFAYVYTAPLTAAERDETAPAAAGQRRLKHAV